MTSKEERTDTNEENKESRPKISGSRKPGGRKKNPKESSKRECKKEKENEKAHERRKTK